jgi:hypothetical protein
MMPLIKRIDVPYSPGFELIGFDVHPWYESLVQVVNIDFHLHSKLVKIIPPDILFHMSFFMTNKIDLNVWNILQERIAKCSSDDSIARARELVVPQYTRTFTDRCDPLYNLVSIRSHDHLVADLCTEVLFVPDLVYKDIFLKPTHRQVLDQITKFILTVETGRDIFLHYKDAQSELNSNSL